MYLNYQKKKKCSYYFFNQYNSDMTSDGTGFLRAVIVFLLCHLDALSCLCSSEPHHGHRTGCFWLKATARQKSSPYKEAKHCHVHKIFAFLSFLWVASVLKVEHKSEWLYLKQQKWLYNSKFIFIIIIDVGVNIKPQFYYNTVSIHIFWTADKQINWPL